MAQPNSRQGLIDYCLRQLGAPVLEINVAQEQIEDLVDDALQFFNERHFDGVSQVYLKYQVTEDDVARGGARRLLFTKIVIIYRFLHQLLELIKYFNMMMHNL